MKKQNSIPFKFILNHLLIVALLFSSTASLSSQSNKLHGVLVTSKQSDITELKRKDIRRIFLGIKPMGNSPVNKPVLNLSNQKAYSLFLKNIMFLTETCYKRKLIKRVFRQGADEIHSIESSNNLIKYLNTHPNDISFMSKEDALKNPDVKIIQALW